MNARIASLHIYPIKSAGGINLSEATPLAKGFRWDRHWMLVGPGGRFVSQRQIPAMAKLAVRMGSDHIEVGFPNKAPLRISLAAGEGEPQPATMHRRDEQILVVDDGDAAAAWFSEALGDRRFEPLRLVRIAPEFERPIPDGVPGGVGLADGYPYLVTSNASLALLNDELKTRGAPENPLSMKRFRPNIVLDLAEPWVEMATGSRLRSEGGGVEFQLAKPCQRCTIPLVDPRTGKQDIGGELHRVLTELSARTEEAGNHFGQNAVLQAGDGSALEINQQLTLQHDP